MSLTRLDLLGNCWIELSQDFALLESHLHVVQIANLKISSMPTRIVIAF
jgi:hypothetical protein